MKMCRWIVILAVAACAASGKRGVAQEKSWKGESVLPTKYATKVKFGDVIDGKQVDFPFSGMMPVRIRDEREGWLRIHDGRREGWADKADFVLLRDAPAFFDRRVQADPKDKFAIYMRGVAWLQTGDLDNAVKAFDECLRIDPKDAAAFVSRGNAWSAKRDFAKAIADHTEAIRLDQKLATAFLARGIAYSDKKEHDKAIKDFDEAIRLDPNYVNAFNNRGIAFVDKKEHDKAIKDFNEAIRLDPKSTEAFVNRGNTFSAKREYDKAINDYDQAIRFDPRDTEALQHRGRARYQAKDYAQAVKDFDEAIRLNPKEAYAAILGHFAARAAKDEVAAQRFLKESAAKLDEGWPLPILRFLHGDLDEPALLKLASDDDKRTEARCYLGIDHALKGRKAEALAHFRWVKDHGNPAFVEYVLAVAELEHLERPAKK